MLRTICTPALALGAVLAVNGVAAAGEPEKSGIGGGFTMTLGGKGTAAAAAAADDTELTHGYRRYGYGGWGGGYGWGGGWGGYRWGYNRSYLLYHPFRPFVNVRRAIHTAPYYYSSYSSYSPVYYGGYGCYDGWGGYSGFGGGYGGYYGISGKEADASTPAVSLSLAVARNPVVPRTSEPAAEPQPAGPTGGFRYDGGPTNPVPFPKPDATPNEATTPATGLPVSLPKAKPKSPYTYKAYGEK